MKDFAVGISADTSVSPDMCHNVNFNDGVVMYDLSSDPARCRYGEAVPLHHIVDRVRG